MTKREGPAQDESELMYLDGQKRGGFGSFLYDKRTGLVMGRSGKQWCQLMIFYVIFYAFLIGFWTACLFGFLSTVSENKPSLTGYDSMLQLNPAVGYRPQPDFESNLIKFNVTVPESYKAYVNDMNEFLAPYFDTELQDNLLDCSNGAAQATGTEACRFDPMEVAPGCFNTTDKSFGFSEGQPCVILKMNRIYGWLPAWKAEGGGFRDVRVRCFGENEADSETLGEMSYYPSDIDNAGYFPSYYFPFVNQKNYLSPLVFVQFKNVKKLTVALIWCVLDAQDMTFGSTPFWSSNALKERAGGAHFELTVDR